MRGYSVDLLPPLKIVPKQLSRFSRSLFGDIEIVLHRRLRRTKNRNWTAEIQSDGTANSACHPERSEGSRMSGLVTLVKIVCRALRLCGPSSSIATRDNKKKTGRKINSPPGLKLGVVTPKKCGVVNPAVGLVPLFLR
jgi:hypothetical protein